MTDKPRFPRLTLKPDSLKRVRRGHRWIFSNEVAEVESGGGNGGEVAVMAPDGTFMGCALYSAHALIAARIYANHTMGFDGELLRTRLAEADALRARFLPGRQAYRVAYSDSDGLPGVVLDRYGRVFVLQLLTVGADARRGMIVDAVRDLFAPAAIVERSDGSARDLEGLPRVSGVLHGELPDSLVVDHLGVRIYADPLKGQKTGLYLDQASNWPIARELARGARVLDLFCHNGGWTLFAGAGGAEHVTSVDESPEALAGLRTAWDENGFPADRVRPVVRDVFQFLRGDQNSYGLVVCDPPAFAKNRKAVPDALRGYREVNRNAMKRVAPGGFLVTCSCSHNVTRDDFEQSLRLSARDVSRSFRVLPMGGQPLDHPVLLGVPESEYLKVFVLQDCT
ncbi:MAG: class I SAM-dependent rRNA methyltransferase [Candidatus Sumerlaeia bacterium]|nr:class I SAM-dependent rRNA methyltransferase [Candidatus Sumerlaeia bacterium]